MAENVGKQLLCLRCRLDGEKTQIFQQVRKQTTTLGETEDAVFSNDISELRPFEDIPGPSGIYKLPYLGFTLQLKPFTKYSINDLQSRYEAWSQEYGPIYKQIIGKDWHVFLTDPKDVEKMFKNDRKYPVRTGVPLFEIYHKRKNLKPGVAGLNGKEWHELRRPAQKSILRSRSVNRYLPSISCVADEFVEKFRGEVRVNDIAVHLMQYTTEGVGKLCFDVRLGTMTKGVDVNKTETMQHVENFLRLFSESLFCLPWFLLYETPKYKSYANSADYLYGLADKFIEDAIKRLDTAVQGDRDPSLLKDMLLMPDMTLEKIRKTLLDVFIAGIDSTAMATTFLLFRLAKHTEKQDILFQELKQHLPPTGPVDESVIKNLRYLKASLKESFRLIHPIATGSIQRILDKEIVLKGYRIPADVRIMALSGIMGKDENLYTDAEEFVPERWLRDNELHHNTSAFATLPFGFGPRKCIGQAFAELEIYVCVAKLLRNYRITLPPGAKDPQVQDHVFRAPTEPISLVLENRND